MIDNTSVRAAQVEKLTRLRAERDGAVLDGALRALTASATSGDGNLMELAIAAAKARATVGEISDALERPWGRCTPSFSTNDDPTVTLTLALTLILTQVHALIFDERRRVLRRVRPAP